MKGRIRWSHVMIALAVIAAVAIAAPAFGGPSLKKVVKKAVKKEVTKQLAGKAGPQGAQGPRGPQGSPGVQGSRGARGSQGPQGPGAQTLSFDASASADPITTLGTLVGVTYGATCTEPSAGMARLTVYLETSDGSWTADVATADSGGAVSTSHLDFDPTTFIGLSAYDHVDAGPAARRTASITT